MPSPAAQAYFNSFDPATQSQIQQSWGGADLMDQWFQNAQSAGAVGPDGQRKGGGGDQGGGVNTGSGQGGMTPQLLRQKAKNEGWSEDFDRFSDELLQGWITRSWDPSKGRFRSEHAPQGAQGDWAYVEKPTEGIVDPQGTEWGPHGNKVGVNLSAMGLNTLGGSVGRPGGGGGGGGNQQGPQQNYAAGLFDPSNPLQNHLVKLAQERGGFFGQTPMNNAASLEGGGIWSGVGGDFSQKFNPLKPRGGNKPRGGGRQNPFEAAAQNPTIAGPQPTPATGPVTQSPFLAGQNGVTPGQASPMQNKLYKMYGGNNTFQSKY